MQAVPPFLSTRLAAAREAKAQQMGIQGITKAHWVKWLCQ